MSETRPIIIPTVSFCHDVGGHASSEIAEFAGCWTLAHEVDEDKAQAKYENGLLRLKLPLKKTIEGKKVKIELIFNLNLFLRSY